MRVGIVWAGALYAVRIGEHEAEYLVGRLSAAPQVVLYSSERLSIAGTGVSVETVQAANSKYHFRYGGLRLLVHTHDRYFLLPAHWQRRYDSVFVIPDNDAVRVDLTVP